jgi:hypothetical protein|tara:strand:+ start:7148 stop:7324 length:177 start_codon:yes stop_codon:yes gene_type:complete
MEKNKLKENIGFFFEIMLFYLAGVLLFKSLLVSLILFSIGLALSIYVGELIKKNALKR